MTNINTGAPRSSTQSKTKNLLTTEEVAAQFNCQPQTPRASYCRKGHWLGLTPIKLPNGRLAWPADAVEHLLNGEG